MDDAALVRDVQAGGDALEQQSYRLVGERFAPDDLGERLPFDEFHRQIRPAQRGLESPASDYLVWIGQRERYRAAWRAFFRDWDVLLMPTFFTPAYPHWDKPWPTTPESIRKTIDVNGKPVLEELGLFWASVATLAGQPATAFPAGLTRAGLPIGLQVIGPYLEDRTPIRFAALVGAELGGFTRPRGYDAD